MIQFIKRLIFGEPALFVGIVGTALSAWVAALTTMGEVVPLWLAIGTPVWVAAGAFFTRQNVTPTADF